jgi:hypothetical protein
VSPYMRTAKTASGATGVQIVHSSHCRSWDIEHLGSVHTAAEVELLKAVGRQELAAGQVVGAHVIFLPRLDMAGEQHAPGYGRGGAQIAEDTLAAAAVHHIQSEYALSHAGRGQAFSNSDVPSSPWPRRANSPPSSRSRKSAGDRG